MIGIVDYGMGNLRSVYNALDYLGCPAILAGTVEAIQASERLILPGVGAYATAMANLQQRGLVGVLQAHVRAAKPLLGICLGMQLLSTRGTEPHECAGLDLIGGKTVLLPVPGDCELPHVGWNNIQVAREHPVFDGVKRHADFYFLHSYHFVPDSTEAVLTRTEYGVSFVSSVAFNNVVGIQFHPEKSQDNGLRILENFSRWDGTC